MRTSKVLTVAAAICGLALSGVAPAIATPVAAPAPAATVNSAADTPLSVDKSVVSRGDTLTIWIDHGPEAMNWVMSDAFTGREENPVGGSEGVGRIVDDADGVATASAVIDDVPPGVYEIHGRVGGGTVPTTTITVQ